MDARVEVGNRLELQWKWAEKRNRVGERVRGEVEGIREEETRRRGDRANGKEQREGRRWEGTPKGRNIRGHRFYILHLYATYILCMQYGYYVLTHSTSNVYSSYPYDALNRAIINT